MGKKGKRSGYGGSGGGGNGKGGSRGAPAAASSGLVVINPALMQSLLSGKPAPPPAKHKPADKKTKQNVKGNGNNAQKRKRNDEPSHTPSKKHAVTSNAPVQEQTNDGSQQVITNLKVAKADHTLAGVYWVLLTHSTKRSAVVVIPNGHASLNPSLLAYALKSLGFHASSIHSKMPAAQRKQTVQRFVQESGSDATGKLALVTNEHHLASVSCSSADLVCLQTSGGNAHKFASVIIVDADGTQSVEATAFEPALTNAALQQLQTRLKVATQIATIIQRLGASASSGDHKDADSKWASRVAKGADLSDDDDDALDRNNKKKNKGTAPNPDEQRLKALNEKLLVLLARDVTTDNATATKTTATQAAASSTSDDAQHRTEKLKILGISMLSAAASASLHDGERLSAQTQWLDEAPGSRFGGEWQGPVRHGASKDSTSLVVRQRVCGCLGGKKPTTTTTHLASWRPNRHPADVDAWGGEYGKVCGHNEVVMHHLRPFFPQEVINSRVCSKRQPAPGNQGFDGCLEFLRLACVDAKRSMTLWDAEHLVFITSKGRVACVKKLQLLTLPLAGLQTLMASLRAWTIACYGCRSPVLLLEGIRLCARLGSDEIQSSRLRDPKIIRRVLAFAIGGSTRVWKQISQLPQPIARQVVYERREC